MPPIPVHLDSPINTNASKPSGVTPQTSAPSPTRTIAPPTTTTSTSSSSPPPPQPGAVPRLPTATASPYIPSNASSPPAPQPGATPYSATTSAILGHSQPIAPPPQASYAPPTITSTPTKSTLADAPLQAGVGRSYPTPTTLNLGPVASPAEDGAAQRYGNTYTPADALPAANPAQPRDISHPPGYTQNSAAFEDRSDLREAARRESLSGGRIPGLPILGGTSGSGGYTGAGGGVLGGNASGEGVVGNVMDGLKSAGESLRKGEEAVWKWVGGKS